MRPKSIADIYVKMKRVKAVLRDLKERARRRDTRRKIIFGGETLRP